MLKKTNRLFIVDLIFEEIDYQETALGAISLRKRSEPRLDNLLIYEVKLNEEWLMSSLFVDAEEELSRLGLQKLKDNGHNNGLSVVVGGLGLGYTSVTALSDQSVVMLRTIDVMPAVIDWHQRGLLPIGDVLATDSRSQLIHGDFFAIASNPELGFISPEKVHAVLLDIDHSPSHWLNQGNQDFYTQESLMNMANKIEVGGVFGLWSNDLPDQNFVDLLNTVFATTETHIVEFSNPYSGQTSKNSVYISTVK